MWYTWSTEFKRIYMDIPIPFTKYEIIFDVGFRPPYIDCGYKHRRGH